MQAPSPLPTLPRVTPVRQQTAAERTDDHFDQQAQATIFGIAQVRREAEALRVERNQFRDLLADERAANAQFEATIREKNAELERQKALTDAWQHEAARLQAGIEIARAALGQVVQPDQAEQQA